jgi:single-stranded DNA-binding protein
MWNSFSPHRGSAAFHGRVARFRIGKHERALRQTRAAGRRRVAVLLAVGASFGALAVGAMTTLLRPDPPPAVAPIRLEQPARSDRAEQRRAERRQQLERRARRAERRERLERRRRQAERRQDGGGQAGAPQPPTPPPTPQPAPAPATPPAPRPQPRHEPAPQAPPAPAPQPAPPPPPPPPPEDDDDDGGDDDADDDEDGDG